LIIPPGESALFYINIIDIMRVFKKIKIISCVDLLENNNNISFDLVDDTDETDNFKYATEKINNYKIFDDMAISDTIIISTE
jgi:hypothetical protein